MRKGRYSVWNKKMTDLRSFGNEFQCGVESKRKCKSHESCVCIVGFSACECQKKTVLYKTESRHVAVQRGKQDQNQLQHQSCLSTAMLAYAEQSAIFLDNVLLLADTAWDFHNLNVIIDHSIVCCTLTELVNKTVDQQFVWSFQPGLIYYISSRYFIIDLSFTQLVFKQLRCQ